MNGIIYYKLPPRDYHQNMIGYDFTKNASLVGNEIDSNFHFLEGQDVYSMEMNGTQLELIRVNNTKEIVKLTPYDAGCGIEITPENEINLRFMENGGISCFNGELYIPTDCGIGIKKEEENCEGFNSFLVKMLGEETAENYINALVPINGEYYGGRLVLTNCDTPFCMDDQFYYDYEKYLKSGKLSLDVCGIVCDENGARINVDDLTLKLDSEECKLKVNYGCGLEVNIEPTENDYINFLEENWGTDTLPGTTEVNLICYLDRTEQVNGNYYPNDFHDDQFYDIIFIETFSPTLNVDLDENGGLVCGTKGLRIDYGCGLTTNNSPDYNEFCQLINIFEPDVSFDETNWQETEFYNVYLNYINSGALSVSTTNGGGISCIGGGLRINLGCLVEIERLTPCCATSEEETDETKYSYETFLRENWDTLTFRLQDNDNPIDFDSYWNGSGKIGCEYFGGSACSVLVCNNCDIYHNDQFFNDYINFIISGRIKIHDCQSGSGGEGYQSDWSENNITSPNFVKNRTHWETDESTIIIIPEAPLNGHYQTNEVFETGPFAYQNATITNQDFLDYLDNVSSSKTEALLKILSYCGIGSSSILFDATDKPEINLNESAWIAAYGEMNEAALTGWSNLVNEQTFGIEAWLTSGIEEKYFLGNFSCYLRFLCSNESISASATENIISTFENFYESFGGSDGTQPYCILPFGSQGYLFIYDSTSDESLQDDLANDNQKYFYYNLKAEEIVAAEVHELPQKFYNHDFLYQTPSLSSAHIAINFESNTRGAKFITINESVVLNIIVNNSSDNYMYFYNDGSQGGSHYITINSVTDRYGNTCQLFIPNTAIIVNSERACIIRIDIYETQSNNNTPNMAFITCVGNLITNQQP